MWQLAATPSPQPRIVPASRQQAAAAACSRFKLCNVMPCIRRTLHVCCTSDCLLQPTTALHNAMPAAATSVHMLLLQTISTIRQHHPELLVNSTDTAQQQLVTWSEPGGCWRGRSGAHEQVADTRMTSRGGCVTCTSWGATDLQRQRALTHLATGRARCWR